MQEKIIILDFGSQYTQLIARRLRELNTYCEILPYNKFPYGEEGIKGVILSGSPYSVNDPNALFVDLSRIRGVYPVLGVCYGAQFLAHARCAGEFHCMDVAWRFYYGNSLYLHPCGQYS